MAFWRQVAQLIGLRDPARNGDWSPPPDEEWPEWERLWRAMPHRRLASPPRFNFRGVARAWGEPAAVTVSLVPPEYAGRLDPAPPRCPICGRDAAEVDRQLANLSPRWPGGTTLGFGCWVHPACFAALPGAGTPSPVPW